MIQKFEKSDNLKVKYLWNKFRNYLFFSDGKDDGARENKDELLAKSVSMLSFPNTKIKQLKRQGGGHFAFLSMK